METKRNETKKNLKLGDSCWIVENNLCVVSGIIRNASGSFYTILLKNGSAVRLKAHRVFETPEEAEKHIVKHQSKPPVKSPYDYWH